MIPSRQSLVVVVVLGLLVITASPVTSGPAFGQAALTACATSLPMAAAAGMTPAAPVALFAWVTCWGAAGVLFVLPTP